MAFEEIPDVSEQTPLPNGPIKIRWQSKDRSRARRSLVASYEDGWYENAVAIPVFNRQKTQVVIKTEEELEVFKDEASYYAKHYVWRRIRKEIKKQYNGKNVNNESKREKLSQEAKKRKENTDLEKLMNEKVIPHARKKVREVWPAGKVDVDEISFFWNSMLTKCAGKAYWGTAVPRKRFDATSPAIGLSPYSYYEHGEEELLETVRHELIHIWQYKNNGGNGGHGESFKQWLEPMNAERYCEHF